MDDSGYETARLAVRLGAIAANYRAFGERCPSAEMAGVVKADAYGLGAAPVAAALEQTGCRIFFVARVEEGIALRPVLPQARIFVLDGPYGESSAALIAHRLIPVLNSLAQIDVWSAAARAHDSTLDCAVHIDTGMNRLGLSQEERATLSAETATRLRDLNIVLWISHLACGDDCTSPMNAQQLSLFRGALASLPAAPASISASAGVLLGRDYHFDLVRPGIGLYGGNPCGGIDNPFAVAAALTAKILQFRRVDTGEAVGYGATFRAARPSTLATVGLGYADGLMRAISNKGSGVIAGVRAPVVGRVSMDLVTLDVTDVPASAVAVGADVEFLGDHISLEELAGLAGTANYEVLTSLGHRVPRHYEPLA